MYRLSGILVSLKTGCTGSIVWILSGNVICIIYRVNVIK